jgi:putative DNA primase/helicase
VRSSSHEAARAALKAIHGGNHDNREGLPDELKNTDIGNGWRFSRQHGEKFRYCREMNQYLAYDGKRWQPDPSTAEASAKDTVRDMAVAASKDPGKPENKALLQHAMRSATRSRIEAMLFTARSEPGMEIKAKDLDGDGHLFNCSNGTVDLRTGELRPHDPDDHISKITAVDYDPGAVAPTWDTFLSRILPDADLRAFMQRLVGYALLGECREEVLPFLYGSGANGKSTCLNAVQEVFGEYAMQAPPELLTLKHGPSHPTELAALMGARCVLSVEVEEGRRLAESLVKQLTGRDSISARYMRQDFFTFEPTHTVFMAANHKPIVKGTDGAIWRRIKLIPFEVVIPENERDPGLQEKLRTESPGILAWAVQGCLEYQRSGLGEPSAVRAATEDYRADMDILAAFIDEDCVTAPGIWIKFADLYQGYVNWCQRSGVPAESKREFGNRLTERGYAPDKGAKNVSIRCDIALRTDREPDPENHKPEGKRVTQDSEYFPSKDANDPDFEVTHDNLKGQRVTHDNPRKADTYAENGGRVTEGYSGPSINGKTNSRVGPTRNEITHGNRVTCCPHLSESVCLSCQGREYE